MQDAGPIEHSRPPRSIALPVHVRLLFGGVVAQIGWFFLGFGLIFVWIFLPAVDLASVLDFRGKLERTNGRVTAVEETAYSTGGGSRPGRSAQARGRKVNAFRYVFEVGGHSYAGVSYGTGRSFEVGSLATVEYPPGRPERSRMMGMRTSPFAPWSALVTIFPLIGLVMIVPSLRRGWRRTMLLRRGVAGRAVLESKTRTNVEIDDHPVFRLTYLFEAEDGSVHQCATKSHRTQRLEDDAEEVVLYDPHRPSCALLVDEIDDRLRADEQGRVGGVSVLGAFLSGLVPAATVIGHGTYVLIRFVP